jgi:hypothetical protein
MEKIFRMQRDSARIPVSKRSEKGRNSERPKYILRKDKSKAIGIFGVGAPSFEDCLCKTCAQLVEKV